MPIHPTCATWQILRSWGYEFGAGGLISFLSILLNDFVVSSIIDESEFLILFRWGAFKKTNMYPIQAHGSSRLELDEANIVIQNIYYCYNCGCRSSIIHCKNYVAILNRARTFLYQGIQSTCIIFIYLRQISEGTFDYHAADISVIQSRAGYSPLRAPVAVPSTIILDPYVLAISKVYREKSAFMPGKIILKVWSGWRHQKNVYVSWPAAHENEEIFWHHLVGRNFWFDFNEILRYSWHCLWQNRGPLVFEVNRLKHEGALKSHNFEQFCNGNLATDFALALQVDGTMRNISANFGANRLVRSLDRKSSP